MTLTLNKSHSLQFAASQLLETLERLEAQVVVASDPQPVAPKRLALRAITRVPEAFNVRGDKNQHHLGQLVRSLATLPDLAPVLVKQCGDQIVLVDGHYRLEAYGFANLPDLPVEFFQGTVRDAYLTAVTRNAATTLPMDTSGRMDCAWNMVNARYTRSQITHASGVSRAQVAVMWTVRKALGDEAGQITAWRKALRASKGVTMPPLTEDEAATFVQAQAEDHAGRIQKACGNKLSTNPEVGALAVALYLGRKLPDFFLQLRDLLSAEELAWVHASDGEEDFNAFY